MFTLLFREIFFFVYLTSLVFMTILHLCWYSKNNVRDSEVFYHRIFQVLVFSRDKTIFFVVDKLK